jgi:hypothetical protein
VKYIALVNIAIIVIAMSCSAQLNSNYQPIPPSPGKYELTHGSLTAPADTLDQLIRRSKLIIDGTADKVLSSVRLDPNSPLALKTFTRISINSVIWGELPKDQKIIALAEPGGNLEGYEVIYKQHPLVKSGERYILFLTPYERKGFVNNLGTPIYTPVGSWAGEAKVNKEGVVRFLPAASDALHFFDGMDMEMFVAAINERIKHLFPTRPVIDTKVLPGPPPPGTLLPPVGVPKLQRDSQR